VDVFFSYVEINCLYAYTFLNTHCIDVFLDGEQVGALAKPFSRIICKAFFCSLASAHFRFWPYLESSVNRTTGNVV